VSGFAPWGSEVRFGPGEDLPALEIHLEDGGILRLRGTIDRVDTAVLDDKLTLVRVIDYKSGWNAPSGGDLEAAAADAVPAHRAGPALGQPACRRVLPAPGRSPGHSFR